LTNAASHESTIPLAHGSEYPVLDTFWASIRREADIPTAHPAWARVTKQASRRTTAILRGERGERGGGARSVVARAKRQWPLDIFFHHAGA